MLHTVRLVIISLAAVGVAFGLYQLGVEPIETQVTTAEIPEIHRVFLEGSTNENAGDRGGVVIDGVRVSGGEKSGITILDDSMRKKMYIRHDGWRQIDETGKRFHLTNPRITFYLPKGQKADVRADEGEMTSRAKDELDPQKGTMWGNVRIVFDRTTDQWRDQHPEEADYPPPQDRLVRIWLGRLQFDLDLGRLTGKGPIRIESDEMKLEGEGLLVRWSETTGRIETLRIEEGKKIVYSGGAGLGVNLSSTAKEDVPGTTLKQLVLDDTIAPPPADAAAASTPTPAPAQTAFSEDEDVIIIRLADKGPVEPQKYNTYIADFTSDIVARQMVGELEEGRLTADHLQVLFDLAAGFSEERSGKGPEESGMRRDEDDTQKQKVYVTWTGPLTISAEDGDIRTGEEIRRQLTATGNPVILENQDGRATCATFVHHVESDLTIFYGEADLPAVIESGPNRRLEAREVIQLDKQSRQVKLRGNVKVINNKFFLAGWAVDAFFDKPIKGSDRTSLPDLLKKLKCYDDVVAVQDTRLIFARKSMFVTFGGLPSNAGGKVEKDSPTIQTLQAEGEVAIVDDVRDWDIAGERLTCEFDADQVITNGYIEAAEGKRAHVQMGAFYIEGQSVEFDEKRKWAHVPGAGVAKFALAEDLDGRRTDEPVAVRVEWQKEMTLRGLDDILTFEGEPVATSENITLRSDKTLRITLADVEAVPETEVRVVSSEPLGMWFLRPYEAEVQQLNNFFGKKPRKSSTLADRFQKRAKYLLADGNARLESRNEYESSGALKSRLTMEAPQIAYDFDSRVFIIEHAGRLLIEDYPNPDEFTQRTGKSVSRGGGLFANVRSEGPSQTIISWDQGMHYYYDERVAQFDGKDKPVHLVHRSGSHIQRLDLVARETGIDISRLNQLAASGTGRKVDLSCRQLFVVFGASQQDRDRGAGEMSIGELQQIHAHDNVLLIEKDQYRVRGDRLVFIEKNQLVEVYGSADERAYLTGVNPKTGRGMDLNCARISIELETWKVHGQDFRGRSYGR